MFSIIMTFLKTLFLRLSFFPSPPPLCCSFSVVSHLPTPTLPPHLIMPSLGLFSRSVGFTNPCPFCIHTCTHYRPGATSEEVHAVLACVWATLLDIILSRSIHFLKNVISFFVIIFHICSIFSLSIHLC